MTDTHTAHEEMLENFEFEHLPASLQRISEPFHLLANGMVDPEIGLEGPEVEAGLRKLLEAKDCFVRAAVARDKRDAKERG